jgi:peptidoglycan/xylan/chitin deacetylase (PgdA/CDA1 family)
MVACGLSMHSLYPTKDWHHHLGRTPIPGVFEQATRRRPLVVMYHSVHDGPAFDRQIAWLTQRYRVVELDSLVDAMVEGETPACDLAAVTFDDGLRSVCSVAWPALRTHGCPATVFVCTAAASSGVPIWTLRIRRMVAMTDLPSLRLSIDGVDRALPTGTPEERVRTADAIVHHCKRELHGRREEIVQAVAESTSFSGAGPVWTDDELPASWSELADLEATGLIRLGNHTRTHPILPRCGDGSLERELLLADRELREHAVRPSRVFCFPNGDVDQRADRILAAAGYSGAVTTLRRRVGTATPPMRVPRIAVSDTESVPAFRLRTSGALDAALAVEAAARRLYSRVPSC